ncbi:transient receptor potential cation channel subfamily A member 1 isoform X2 [Spodoptera frugiperda]|uniref:Transient receptor potential cation channel subfamily A member 1 isoform X2 n=1 Tax=Spodoptera frugiperda TaxID=7108 RepID=A0A9R0D2N7_SPOFR|nr:transient receptor potential cation channel subfamily A member 1 isoform X2 [Spodoptera frugiperda]
MWLLGGGAARPAQQRACRGPAILSTPDGAMPSVQVITHNFSTTPRKRGLAEWVWTLTGQNRQNREKVDPGGELQIMLPAQPDKPTSGEVCLLAESPFRILRAAESGNVEDFMRLYLSEPSRLAVRDGRGRTAAHQAAARNNTNILHFINNYGGDLNAKDNFGNTPLHIAVENVALDAIEFLLQHRVDTNILNDKSQGALHLATELNRVSVLQTFAKYKDQFNVELGGEHGRTALHFAAIHDHDICAKILITDLGAECKRACNNGYYPIHEAAKNASSRTMEVFLQWGESKGCTRESMISLYDNEGNVPLHSAVHGGDIKAVELCLKSGAKISTQQYDLSTPVHLACAQGALEIVKLMFTMQPTEKLACLTSCDVQKMTPVHCAAMFDHPDIVNYLINEGSDINPLDKERRSPLLLAASRAGWRTVQTLIRLGADIELKDINSRNVLHLVVMNGGRLEEFAATCKSTLQNRCERSLAQLLNEKDSAGCSPLHYASREGHIRSLENLIRLGACINLKNNNNESPLHFAARYGRYHTACQLLDSDKGTFIINESDGEGLTPLHIASREGHTRVVHLLLNRGALLHRDHNGRNPLHLAAMSGYTQTIELLHSVHSHLLDQSDKDGNTPLHLATMENKPNSIALLLSMGCRLSYNNLDMSAIDYAIYYKFPEAALAMVTHEQRAKEVMALRSDRHPCVTLALIAYMPRVFEAVQDKCITKANCKKDSKSFYIKYSFDALCPQLKMEDGNNVRRKSENVPKSQNIPLPALNAMVAHGRVELLAHPLSQKYLQMKWHSYGKYFHLANLLFYCIFLIFVTVYTYLLMGSSENYAQTKKAAKCNLSDPMNFDRENKTEKNNVFNSDFESKVAMYTSTVAILAYNAICLIREAYNVKQQKWHYLVDPSNLVSWLLYISSTLMVIPTICNYFEEIQFSAASITVFLSWFELLLLLQRFDQVGIYVVMFLEILQTLIKVLMVFSILIIAFGMAFYILLSKGHHLSFNSIPMSLMRTFAMMLGELDFVGTYVQPYYKSETDILLPFPMPTFFILGIFMVLMPILLMNLLIGLAVGDIESVRRNAQLKRLAMQVVLHTELERKLPAILLEKVDKDELIEYPNNKKCKLGFLDLILRKWFCNPFTDDAGLDLVLESSEDYITAELEKQKRKLRDISLVLEQQHTLVRLIVQKMEIKTEADDVDEGVSPGDTRVVPRWSSPRIRKKLRTASSFNKGG